MDFIYILDISQVKQLKRQHNQLSNKERINFLDMIDKLDITIDWNLDTISGKSYEKCKNEKRT